MSVRHRIDVLRNRKLFSMVMVQTSYFSEKKSELMVFSLSIETKKLHTKLLVIIYI